MAIEALAAVAAKEIGTIAAKEIAIQAGREIAQKMAAEASVQEAGKELQAAMMERQTMQEGFRVGEMPETRGEGREILKQRELDAADELRAKFEAEEPSREVEPAPEPESPEAPNAAMSEKQTRETTQSQEAGESTELGGAKKDVEVQEAAETLERVEGQDALHEKIKKETGWSDEIVDSIRNEAEYDVYKKADLKEGTVNGKQCLQREIDLSFKDDFGKTNLERMQEGKSPIDAKSGDKIELHHMGQRADSPFAELRENIDHGDGNHKVLHDLESKSWRHEPGRVAEYNKQKAEYWKTRAEQLLAA